MFDCNMFGFLFFHLFIIYVILNTLYLCILDDNQIQKYLQSSILSFTSSKKQLQ